MYYSNCSVPLVADKLNQVFGFCPELEINGHIGITGASGAGKSRMLARLISGISRVYPMIILSPHPDLCAAFGGGVVVTEDGISGYSLNPIDITYASISKYGVIGVVNRAIDMLERATSKFGSAQRGMLYDLLLGEAKAFSAQDPLCLQPCPRPTLASLVSLIQGVAENGEQARRRDVAERLLDRLKPFSSMPLFNLVDEIEPAVLSKGTTVFDMSRMSSSARILFSQLLLRAMTDYLCSLGVIQPGLPKHRLFFIIDEAQVFFDGKDGKNDSDHPLNIIATEGRKFGASLIMASQRLDHFGEDFICNTAMKMVLGPVSDAREKKKLVSVYGLGRDAIKSLSMAGSAYISSGLVPAGVYRVLC